MRKENTAKQLVKVMHLLWTLSMERPILSKIITEAACLWDWHFMGLWKSALFITHTVMRCFYAQRGKGAFLNGQPLHVSSNQLEEGLVCFGTSPYYAELIDQTFDLVKTLHKASLDVRRSGSAALDLCDIASGRCELFFECRLSPWDYAAGSLIVQEAGGRISRMDGTGISLDKGCSVLAGGPAAWEDYFKLEGHMELS